MSCVVLNRAQKKLSAVAAWENSKKASLEAKLKKIEVTWPLLCIVVHLWIFILFYFIFISTLWKQPNMILAASSLHST